MRANSMRPSPNTSRKARAYPATPAMAAVRRGLEIGEHRRRRRRHHRAAMGRREPRFVRSGVAARALLRAGKGRAIESGRIAACEPRRLRCLRGWPGSLAAGERGCHEEKQAQHAHRPGAGSERLLSQSSPSCTPKAPTTSSLRRRLRSEWPVIDSFAGGRWAAAVSTTAEARRRAAPASSARQAGFSPGAARCSARSGARQRRV